MMRMWKIGVIGLAASLAVPVAALADTDAAGNTFQEAELVPGPGMEEVELTCAACHSLNIVVQQGLTKEDWDELLDWMIEEQGMAELEDEERKLIVEYLATNYGTDRELPPR
jgi:cytochrome c